MFVYISFTSVYTIESAVFTRPQALHMDTALFPQIPHRHVCSEKHLRREIQEHSLELRRQESVLVWRDRERETVEKERDRDRHLGSLLTPCLLSSLLIFTFSVGKLSGAGTLSQETLVMTRFVQKTRRLATPTKGSISLGRVGFFCIALAPWPASVCVSS